MSFVGFLKPRGTFSGRNFISAKTNFEMFVEHFSRSTQQVHNSPRAFSFPNDPLLCKLCPADQADFMHLMNLFAFSDDRNKRNLGMPTFIKHLSMIHSFVCRGDPYDALRGLVCGIEFGLSTFLINTSRLKKLMYRSKSCMNGCFQKLGYNVCRPAHDITSLFAQILPGFGAHMFTSRQWCVRKAGENSSLCFIPNIKIEIASSQTSHPSSPIQPPHDDTIQNIISSHNSASNSLIMPGPKSRPQSLPSISNLPGIQNLLGVPPMQMGNMSSRPQSLPKSILVPNNADAVSCNNSCNSDNSCKEVEDQKMFMFDIQTLLNHQAPHPNIHRMSCGSLPPLRI